jgi:hypothetical protein
MEIEQVSEELSVATLKDINEAFHREIDEFSQDINMHFEEIKGLIESLIIKMELYQNQVKMLPDKTIASTM